MNIIWQKSYKHIMVLNIHRVKDRSMVKNTVNYLEIYLNHHIIIMFIIKFKKIYEKMVKMS